VKAIVDVVSVLYYYLLYSYDNIPLYIGRLINKKYPMYPLTKVYNEEVREQIIE